MCSGKLLPDSTLGLSEIDWHLEKVHVYLGSPSIIRYHDQLLASHDYFGSGLHPTQVSVFRSSDEGLTWTFLANVSRMYFANFFEHRDSLYLMGIAHGREGRFANNTDVAVSCSTDGGKTWSDAATIFAGPYHTAPTPLLNVSSSAVSGSGTLFRAMEYRKLPATYYGSDFTAVMIRGDASCENLTKPECWNISNILPFNRSWIPAEWGNLTEPSWQEGNAVETPGGDGVVIILRFNDPKAINKAALVDYDASENFLHFRQFIEFPGGHTKFTIRRHPATGVYWTLSNNVTNPLYGTMRNILTLSHSVDLITWHVCKRRLLEDDTGFDFADSVRFTGFHYVDWQFDGAEETSIIYAIRTSYRGANTYHNSNRLTFKKLIDFETFCSD